jgi:hypothetical protein
LALALANDKDYATTITNALATKAPLLSPTFTGVVTCTNGITAGDNVWTIASKPTGSGNVVNTIENTGVSGFAICYWKAPNESGQIFVGQLGGINLRTNTAHPIQFATYTNEAGATTSMKILANATRDVEILAPLNIKSLSTVIDNGVTIGGNLTVNGFTNTKPYISLRITTSGGTPGTVLNGVTTIGTPGPSVGINCGSSAVTLARGTAGATNAFLYTISWTTAHPLGSNYAVMCNFQGGSTANLSPNGFFRANGTATSITVWVRTSDGIIKDENFYVYSVP